jgi:hypothetical protein
VDVDGFLRIDPTSAAQLIESDFPEIDGEEIGELIEE